MRHAFLIGILALAACGHGSTAVDAGEVGAPANLAGDWAFPVGVGSVGTTGPDNVTFLFQERGSDGCLPAGARSVAVSLRTTQGGPLAPGTFEFGLDAGAPDAGSSSADGGGDAGAPNVVDAGAPPVDVSATYTDGDAGIVDVRARSGTVTIQAIDASLGTQGAGNSGTFELRFVTLDGHAHTLNGAYDLARNCQ